MTVAASNLSPLQSTSSFEINDITLHIVDQETKNRFDEERSRLEELKLHVPEEGETSETVRKNTIVTWAGWTKRSTFIRVAMAFILF